MATVHDVDSGLSSGGAGTQPQRDAEERCRLVPRPQPRVAHAALELKERGCRLAVAATARGTAAPPVSDSGIQRREAPLSAV